MCPEQAWPWPALTETPTEGLDLSGSHIINSPMPELLPAGAWTSEGASALLGSMEGKMRTGMVPSSKSTESSRGEYCGIRSGEATDSRCLAMWRMTTKASEQMWPKISQWVNVLQSPERVRGRKCDLWSPGLLFLTTMTPELTSTITYVFLGCHSLVMFLSLPKRQM